MEFALKQGRVLVLDAAEAKERWESASFWNEMEYMLQSNRMHFSKAVVLADSVVGEIIWHPEEAYDGRAVSIIYYLDRSELVLIGQKTRHDHWEKQLRSLISDEDDLSPVRFFIAALGLAAPAHPVAQEQQEAGEDQRRAHEIHIVAQALHCLADGQHRKQRQRTDDDQQDEPAGGRHPCPD